MVCELLFIHFIIISATSGHCCSAGAGEQISEGAEPFVWQWHQWRHWPPRVGRVAEGERTTCQRDEAVAQDNRRDGIAN